MSLKTIIFVHGAWHSPKFFDKVIGILEPHGYRCVVVSLPGTGSVPTVKNLDADNAAVREVVLKEIDAGNDVMVNAHSWGGVPACSALDGLSKAERERNGKQGAVTKLSFVSSFVLPEGWSIADALGGPKAEWVPDENGNLMWPPEVMKDVFYHDIPSEEADERVAVLRPQAHVTFLDKTKSAAWRKIPSSYLICENDRPLPLAIQEEMIARIKKEGGEIETERLFVSHSPHLAMPEKVAEFIRRAAGEDLKSSW